MKRTFPVIFSICLLGITVGHTSPGLLKSLSPEQQKQVEEGGQVVISTDVPGGPWPRLQVYQKVNAPVSEVETVFRDYKDSADYSPGVDSVEVLSHPSPNVYDVRYNSSMPIVGKTSNTVRNTFSHDGDALVVKWHLLDSTLAEESTGELRAEPYGDGSILRYTNYVKPKSSLAVLAKGAALSEVKKTVKALAAETERRYDAKR